MRARDLCIALSLAGCTSPRCPEAIATLPGEPAFAVVLSDYASSALAVLDDDGEVLSPAWVTSGSRAPLLVTPISGDVVLPQRALGAGRVAWIDRYSIDVLTIVAMPDGEVVSQADLRGDDGDFSPNPQDALALPDGRILVSRLNPNLDGSVAPVARGNDLVLLDPSTHAIESIPLGCDVTVDGTTFFARPAELAILRAGDRAVVVAGLARLDASFMALGPGAVALLDATTLAPIGCLPLAPLGNCTAVDVEPGAPDRALVLCTGPTFAGTDARRRGAGIVEIELGPAGVTERARYVPEPGDAVPTGWLVATGPGTGAFVADPRGEATPYPDRLLGLDLASGEARVVAEAEPFALGLGAVRDGLLLVPDAGRRAVLRLDLGADGPVLRDEVPILGCAGLPPRQIGPLER